LEARKQDSAGSVTTLEIVLYVVGAFGGIVIIVIIAIVVVRHRRKSTHPDDVQNRGKFDEQGGEGGGK